MGSLVAVPFHLFFRSDCDTEVREEGARWGGPALWRACLLENTCQRTLTAPAPAPPPALRQVTPKEPAVGLSPQASLKEPDNGGKSGVPSPERVTSEAV